MEAFAARWISTAFRTTKALPPPPPRAVLFFFFHYGTATSPQPSDDPSPQTDRQTLACTCACQCVHKKRKFANTHWTDWGVAAVLLCCTSVDKQRLSVRA